MNNISRWICELLCLTDLHDCHLWSDVWRNWICFSLFQGIDYQPLEDQGFMCLHCQAKFTLLQNCRRHIAGKHLHQLYHCPVMCGATFTRIDSLRYHLRRVHQNWSYLYCHFFQPLNVSFLSFLCRSCIMCNLACCVVFCLASSAFDDLAPYLEIIYWRLHASNFFLNCHPVESNETAVSHSSCLQKHLPW